MTQLTMLIRENTVLSFNNTNTLRINSKQIYCMSRNHIDERMINIIQSNLQLICLHNVNLSILCKHQV